MPVRLLCRPDALVAYVTHSYTSYASCVRDVHCSRVRVTSVRHVCLLPPRYVSLRTLQRVASVLSIMMHLLSLLGTSFMLFRAAFSPNLRRRSMRRVMTLVGLQARPVSPHSLQPTSHRSPPLTATHLSHHLPLTPLTSRHEAPTLHTAPPNHRSPPNALPRTAPPISPIAFYSPRPHLTPAAAGRLLGGVPRDATAGRLPGACVNVCVICV